MQLSRRLACAATALLAGAAAAHEGHGLAGVHWHASDTWGFIVVAALAALAIWLSRGK